MSCQCRGPHLPAHIHVLRWNRLHAEESSKSGRVTSRYSLKQQFCSDVVLQNPQICPQISDLAALYKLPSSETSHILYLLTVRNFYLRVWFASPRVMTTHMPWFYMYLVMTTSMKFYCNATVLLLSSTIEVNDLSHQSRNVTPHQINQDACSDITGTVQVIQEVVYKGHSSQWSE